MTVEDHFEEGGLGEAVITALSDVGVAPKRSIRLAVHGMPHSGKPEELLDKFGISASHIADAVKDLISK